jgi:hypothetical protein
MIIQNGLWVCECGMRAVHNPHIGWKCPEHGVAGKVE